MEQQTMKAMAISEYGSIDRVQPMDLPVPSISENEILIRNRASSVNPADLKVLTGKMKMMHKKGFPLVAGYDYSGVVERVGAKVKRFKAGDEVFGHHHFSGKTEHGAFAEFTVATPHMLTYKPSIISHHDAASLATTASTAYRALVEKANVQSGMHVLIRGASGGVGSAAIQIAKAMGAIVTATCSVDRKDLVRSLGADEWIDYKNETIPGRPTYDVVFDVVSNSSYLKYSRALKESGTYVTLLPSFSFLASYLLTLFSLRRVILVVISPAAERLEHLVHLIEGGKLHAVCDSTFPLIELQKALVRMDSGRPAGKVVIEI